MRSTWRTTTARSPITCPCKTCFHPRRFHVPTAPATRGDIAMSATQDVLNHHLTCFAASDLEGTLADYAEDAVIITPQGVLKGLSEIRMFFENGYAEFGQPG